MPLFKKKKRFEPFVPSNTLATSGKEDADAMKLRDYESLPADQQELFNQEEEKPFNIGQSVALALSAVAALIPEREIKAPVAPTLEKTHQNPLGTGSEAIFKKGGKVKKCADGGILTGGGGGKKKKKPLEQLEEIYNSRESKMVYDQLSPYDYSSDTIKLSQGKFKGAAVPKQLIADAVKAAKANGVDPYDMLALIGQESTFGAGSNFESGQRARSRQELISGWDLDQSYRTYGFDRYLADQKVPGVITDKGARGYSYGISDPDAVNAYLEKNPNLITQYQQRIQKQGAPQKVDYFHEAAKLIKKKGIASYNPASKTYAQEIAKSKKLLQSDPSIKKYMTSMKKGGKIDLSYAEGGEVEMLSTNPYDGGTLKFKGPSHERGGIQLTENIEVEGGETASADTQGNLTIFGNMKVPGTNKKFKEVVDLIGKEEAKIQKTLRKGAKIMPGAGNHELDILQMNSKKMMEAGAQMKMAKLAESKEMLSMIQQAMLGEQAGKIKARKGITLDGGEDPKKKKPSMAVRHNNPGNIKYGAFAKKYGAVKGEPATDGGHFAKFPDTGTGMKALKGLLKTSGYKNLPVGEAIKRWTNGAGYQNMGDFTDKKVGQLSEQELNKLYDIITVGEDGKYYDKNADNSTATATPTSTPEQEVTIDLGTPPGLSQGVAGRKTTYTDPNRPSNPLTGELNGDRPQLGSVADQNKLDLKQILPEIYSIVRNPVEPVFAQRYTPELFQPYQISLQDRLNENQATFNALSRTAQYNPSALGTLAAQKYIADSQVLGEEFRINQGISNEVTNKNVALNNDAQLKNLQIGDTQMVRQSTARSKTKAQNQLALNSISNKFLQNQLENTTARTYEPLFDYRYDESGNLVYAGADAQFNFEGNKNNGILPIDPATATEQKFNGNNQLQETKLKTPSAQDQLRDQFDLFNYGKRPSVNIFSRKR